MTTVEWKAYEEVNFNDRYILRWVREGDEYVNKMTKDMMEDLKSVVCQLQAENEELKKEKWMTEVNVQQQTLAYIIKLLTIQHDTLACTSYPMSKENREAIKK